MLFHHEASSSFHASASLDFISWSSNASDGRRHPCQSVHVHGRDNPDEAIALLQQLATAVSRALSRTLSDR
jgi:hypothetical protein